LWSPATGLSSSTSNNPTLTLGAAGVTTYTVTEKTTATGCSASTSVAITSLSLPAANAGSNATICSGSPYTIGAGSVSGSTYSWSPSAGLSSSTASNPVVTPASAGSYTYAVTETNGTCSNTNSVVITANPQPIAIAGASATVCSGTAYTLGTGTTSGNTYAWTPSTGLSSATVSNPTATPASATTYTLTQTITVTGCVATATVNVGVNALPAAAAGANASICSGASYTLGAGTLPVSGSTYSWSPSTSLSSSTVFNPVATPGSTTTYTVTETNSNNCVASNTIKVTINTPAAFAGAAQTVCAGSSVQIGTTAVGGSTYAWSPSTGLSSSTASNPTLAAASAGSFTYTVTETNSTSCTNSNSVVITVNPTPTPTAGAPGTVCAGTAYTIGTGTAVGGDTYSWSPSTGLSSSTVSGPVATPSSTTTYTVTEKTTATGCAASATVKVTALPAPAANAGAAAFICPGGSANIGAAPVTGDTYLWTPALGLTSNKASNPIATPSSTTTYTLTETNSIGCSASNSVTVKINIPAAATASPATICGGTPTSVGAATVVGSTYSWVSSPAGFTSTAGNPVAAPFVTTTYTVTEVNSTGCTNTNSVTITVNPAPAAAVGPPVTICNGSSASIGAAPVSGSTYSWTPSTGLSSATVSNPTVSASATTTYILTETNSLGCSAQHSVVVTVRVVAANAGSNASVCAGGSATIGAASVSGSTYSWSPSTGLSSTAVSNPNATPLATTVYTVTETNGACSASHSVTVTVNSLPAAAAGSNTSVCLGNSATLGAALVSGSSYSWSPSAGLSSSVAAQPSATPTVTTTYSVTETNTAGCTASHSVTVTVNALPLAAAGSNAAVCPGGSTVIGSTAVTGSTYTWSPATGLSSSTVSNPTATPASTTTYTVTEKNTSNCTASNSVTVTVNTLPVAATGPAQTICPGSSTTIGAAAVTGSTYAWVSLPAGFTSASANPTVSPTAATSYTVTETNVNGCVASHSVTVSVGTLPAAAAGSPATVCAGTGILIGAPAVSGSNYAWTSTPPGFTSVSANPSVAPLVTTTYTVTETNALGCVVSHSVTISVNTPAAAAGVNMGICSGTSTTIGAAPVTGSTYSWASAPAGFSSTVSNPIVSPTVNTTYTVTETNAFGCVASNSMKVTINNTKTAANPGVPSTICAGTSVSIGSLAVAGSFYVWTSSPAGFSSTISDPVVSPTVTTTYTVIESNVALCSNTNTVTITVNPFPAANAGTSALICSGSTAVLGGAAVAGSTYSWTSSPSGFTSNASSISIAPTVTTTYTLTETNAGGCVATHSATITVNTPAALAGSAGSFVCPGTSFTIGGAPVAGSTYSWTNSATLSSSTVSNPTASPLVTTTYTVTETNITGCVKSNSVTLTYTPPTAGSGRSICTGTSTTLGGTSVAGSTYTWSPVTALSSSTTNNPTANPTATTTYTLTEVYAAGCTQTNTVTVTVNPLPAAAAGAARNICPGSTTTIGATAVSGSTYTWSPITGLSSSTLANPVVAPISATTTYSVTETNSNGCVNTNSVKLTLIVPPVANAGNNATICAGNTVQLGTAALTGITYSWLPTTALTASNIAQPFAAPTTTTTYTVTAANFCPTTSTVTITVNPLPAANAGGGNAICLGGTDSIGSKAVVGNTYSWSPAASLSSASAARTLSTPKTTTVYTLTERITATGCSNSGTVTVTVNPLPGANTGTGASICLGGSTVIGASPVLGSIYSWTSVPKGFTSTNSSVTVSPVDTTIYTLVETDAITGCTNSGTVAVDPINLPVANVSTSPVCFGNNGVVVVNSAVSGESFKWYLGGTLIPGQTSFQTITNVAGAYSAQVTNTNTGCSAMSNVVSLVINPLPINIVKTIGSSVGCQGDSFVMVAPLDSNDSYQWKINGKPISGANSYIYAAKQSGLYNVVITSTTTGCSDSSSSFPVTINPRPAAPLNISGATTFCNGKSVGFNTAHYSGVTYTWYQNSVAIAANDTDTYNATTSGNYYVQITIDTTGCSSTSTVVPVTVNPLPTATASAGGNTNLCPGTSVLLLANPNSTYTYRWLNSSGYIAGANSDTFSVSQADNYGVTVTNSNGCSANSNLVSVTAASFPTVSIVRPSSTSFCQSAVTLTTADTNVGSYQWYLNGSIIPGATDSSLVTNQTGLYTVSVNGTVTCTAHDTISITVNPAPVAAFFTSKIKVCDGEGLTFVNQSSISSNSALTYVWSFGDGGSSTNQNPSYSYSTAGVYPVKLTATSAAGCTSSTVDTITAVAVTSSAFNVNFEGYRHYGFTASDLTGTTYTWYFGDSSIAYGKTPYHEYANSGTYKVTLIVTNANGCSSTTTQTLTVNLTGIQEATQENVSISVFPNPFKTQTNVVYTLKQDASVRIDAYDVTGKRVAHVDNTMQIAGEHTYIFNGSVPGTYFIKMTIDGQSYMSKVVQQ